MFIHKSYSIKNLILFTKNHILFILVWNLIMAIGFKYAGFQYLSIPVSLISILGTATAFYLGFKNNSSYARLWEARKIWGGIINTSRSMASDILNLTSKSENFDKNLSTDSIDIIKRIIRRQIAWAYALRSSLLTPTSWEHSEQKGAAGKKASEIRKKNGVNLSDIEKKYELSHHYIKNDEFNKVLKYSNISTQLLKLQGEDFKVLRDNSNIDALSHIHLQKHLNDFYSHQGKCERIKKFPLPRQYATASLLFVRIFVLILPLAILPLFLNSDSLTYWLSVPSLALISWVFIFMELVGDFSENPFSGLASDIPMLSLCRTIEIDLLEMMDEEVTIEPIKAIDGVLI